jgi:hypothetical protein
MIKIVVAVRRKPGMTHAEYLRYIYEVHGAIARANTLGLDRYVQNHIFDGAFGKAAYARWFHRDSITELYFSSFERLVQTFNHPYTRDVIGPDGAKFSDLGSALSLLTTEQVVQKPSRSGNTVKVLHFLKAREAKTFATQWQQAHAAAIRAVPEFEGKLHGHIRSISQQPAGGASAGGSEYFGGGDMPKFDGVASFWFAGEQDLEAFRRYETALGEQGFFDSDLSFFVYAREVDIFDLTSSDSSAV